MAACSCTATESVVLLDLTKVDQVTGQKVTVEVQALSRASDDFAHLKFILPFRASEFSKAQTIAVPPQSHWSCTESVSNALFYFLQLGTLDSNHT